MADTPRVISDGVWCVYVSRRGGPRLLDGEAADSAEARRLFHNSIRDEPETTLVELVNPQGRIVDQSRGAHTGPHSALKH